MRRAVLGRRNNGDYGLFCSPSGVDAFTASDAELGFSTMLPHNALVHAKGMIGALTASYQTATFAALDYVPLVMAGYYDPANNYYYYFQREDGAYYIYNPSGGGSVTISTKVGPRVVITNSSISMAAYNGHGWYGHYTVLRIPGGG